MASNSTNQPIVLRSKRSEGKFTGHEIGSVHREPTFDTATLATDVVRYRVSVPMEQTFDTIILATDVVCNSATTAVETVESPTFNLGRLRPLAPLVKSVFVLS